MDVGRRSLLYAALAATALASSVSAGKPRETPLMAAAAVGDEDAVERVLAEGVDVNAAAFDGSTALMRAALGGHEAVVAILLEAGADRGLKSNNGWTATRWAIAANQQALVDRLTSRNPPPLPATSVWDDGNAHRGSRPGLAPPRLLEMVRPSYSRGALERKVRGKVILEVVILASGEVGAMRVTRSLELELDLRAMQTARRWKFEPGRFDGEPVSVVAELVIDFDAL